MTDNSTFDATTFSVLGLGRTEEAVGVRSTVPAVLAVKGTGLSVAGSGMRTGALGLAGAVQGPDQVQKTAFIRVRTSDDRGIPPRRTPVRC